MPRKSHLKKHNEHLDRWLNLCRLHDPVVCCLCRFICISNRERGTFSLHHAWFDASLAKVKQPMPTAVDNNWRGQYQRHFVSRYPARIILLKRPGK